MSPHARKIAGSAALAAALFVSDAAAETRYVSPAGLHVPPFANWEEAATNIQSAIDVSHPGDVVVVTNGHYVLAATVRVTNQVALASLNGRDAVNLDGSALAAGQDAVFLQFGALDGFTVSNAPRNGVKCESGAILNCLITHSRSNGIDSYTTPRIVPNSTLIVSNTIIQASASNGLYTCAVDTRIENCLITGSGGSGVSLRQNDTVGVKQVPRVSNFVIQASTVSSNLNSGISLAFWNYSAALPDVPMRIEDCVIEDNVGVGGGGIGDGAGIDTDRSSGVQITGCLLRRNTGTYGGGAMLWGKRSPSISYSIIENNVATIDGGGAYMVGGSMYDCLVQGNECARDGGGSWGGILRNNTLVYNKANRGGGAAFGEVLNCIAYYNKANVGSNVFGGTVSYSCIAPAVLGEGNLSDPPGLAGFRNWRLVPGSPCIDAGSWSFAEDDFDLEGDPRIWGGGIDMGCDEFYSPGLGGLLAVEVVGSADRAVVGAPVSFKCDVDGRPESYVWNFSDGYAASNTPYVDRSFDAPGIHTATVTASNVDDVASASVSIEIFPGYTNFVSPSGAHVPPFTNQVDAATNIQDAIAANIPGGVVRVADGTYAEGGVPWPAGLTNRIAITNVMEVVSVNGPDRTAIVGQGPCGDDAVRCAYVASGARLVGFTLTNGHTRAAGDADLDQSGGGAWCEPGGILENCVIRNNVAAQRGGGIKNGLAQGSTLCANRAQDGGGAHAADLSRCVLSNNVAAGKGGGAHGGTLANVWVVDNLAEYGGGVALASLAHATVVNNHAAQSGGGVYRGMVSNSILYFNTAGVSWSNYFNSICRYSCTTPDPQSIGNVTADPRFVDAANGVFRLHRDSPAVDSAQASDLAVDLLGAPRPLPARPEGVPAPDMGAYEYTAAHYVAPGGAHVPPFVTWADAARDLQSAIDAADPMDAVFASNGVYNTGGRVRHGALTNRVVIDKPIRVVAVQGPAHTAIEGAGPVGDAAVRGVLLGADASLVGFTVRGGATRARGDGTLEQSGGGIWSEAGSLVSNCVVVSNSAAASGGGAYGGRLVNSFLNANAAAQGGGLARGEINFCTVTENHAVDGGGVYEGTGRCSIVYFNAASGAGPNVLGGAWNTCCVTPDPGGPGHIVADPGLLAAGGFRLASGSPCIDALPAGPPFPGDDLDGTPRPLDGMASGEAKADIGAHEFIHATADTDGDGLSDSDEIHVHGTAPLLRDTDGDQQSDRDEIIAGTDPFDPDSLFAILQVAVDAAGQIFSWPGRANRLYTILATDDMAGPMTNRLEYTDRPGVDGPMSFTNALPSRVDLFGVRVRMAP
ncbi:MAG: PKD domain-containing protein [Opitutae bacterium]|nr:PKD domain-containing protein [Opitutae bacterium]